GGDLARELGVELVTLGPGNVQREAEDLGRLQPGVGHVVGVADPGHRPALDGAAHFHEGEDVGKNLTGVVLVGQPVDDRYPRVRCEAFDACLFEGADHHNVHHA